MVTSPDLVPGRNEGDEVIVPIPGIGLAPLLPEGHVREAISPQKQAEVNKRRLAVRALGRAVRRLGSASVLTEVEIAELDRVTQLVESASDALSAELRRPEKRPSVDDELEGFRMYAPLLGEGNPLFAPFETELSDEGAVAFVTLGTEHHGPPRHVHGGVSSMIMDHILGHVVAFQGIPAVTRELVIRYRRPVPLDVELRVEGRVSEESDGRLRAFGSIALASAPDTHLVEAEGEWRVIRADLALMLLNAYTD